MHLYWPKSAFRRKNQKVPIDITCKNQILRKPAFGKQRLMQNCIVLNAQPLGDLGYPANQNDRPAKYFKLTRQRKRSRTISNQTAIAIVISAKTH